MNDKIGLLAVTYHNYGSILQSYALQIKVNSYGRKTEIINFSETRFAKINRCRDGEYLYTRLKMMWKVVKMKFQDKQQATNLRQRHGAYDKFIKEHFKFSKHTTSLKELREMCRDYKLVILGSDQVWHPMNVYMNFFTMNFVPSDIIKAAFAPSFGVNEIPSKYKKFYHNYLSRIEYLSCREKSGVDLVKQLSAREVLHVCDPTMLLTGNEWSELVDASPKVSGKYIFCYLLGNNSRQRNLASKIKETTGCSIVALTHIDEYVKSDDGYADETPYDVGPLEFLNLLKNAEYVMTDSFHASVFSILFHKKFFVFNRFEATKGKSTITRINSLLEVVGLEDRFFYSDQGASVLLQKKAINWNHVDRRLNDFRKISVDYLETILKRVDEI